MEQYKRKQKMKTQIQKTIFFAMLLLFALALLHMNIMQNYWTLQVSQTEGGLMALLFLMVPFCLE